MAITVYPLNQIDYTAEDVAVYNSTRTSGIYAGDDFAISLTGSDNTISIDVGIAWMRLSRFHGVAVAMKTKTAVDMGIPDSVYPRIDALVLQFDANKNGAELVVKSGSASSNPQPPALSRSEALYELHLLHVRRIPGAASITSGNLTDLRMDERYCGLMADAVTRVDTAAINAQISELIQKLSDDLQKVEDNDYYASKDYVAAAITTASPYNYLDNSDFTNPVNQRGETTYETNGYHIDRWRSTNSRGSCSIVAGGVSLSATIEGSNGYYWNQYIDAQELSDKPVTAAAYLADGTVVLAIGTFPAEIPQDDNLMFAETVFSGGCALRLQKNAGTGYLSYRFFLPEGARVTIKHAALYSGAFTEETVPQYRPKGYSTELAECQRYYLPVSNSPIGFGYCQASGGQATILIPTPVLMRIIPSLPSTNVTIRTTASSGVTVNAKNISATKIFANGVVLSLAHNDIPKTVVCSAWCSGRGYELSADL